jgi:competence protein ComEC
MKKSITSTTALLIITLFLIFLIEKDNAKSVLFLPLPEGEMAEGQRGWESKSQVEDKPAVDYVDINFLDIGQGDATLINFSDGTQMLIDCSKDSRVLEALGRVMPFYDNTINYLFITHPDLDHYGGCEDVLNNYNIDHIFTNGVLKKTDSSWKSLLSSFIKEGAEEIDIGSQQTMVIASTTVNILYPDHAMVTSNRVPGATKDTGDNNASVILKISYGEMDALLTGDAEAELEEYLLKTYSTSTLDVEVYKAGHHGSAGSSIQSFVDVLSPLYTIFSAGKENSYGHPSLRIIRRVERAGSRVRRTDEQGDIRVRMFLDRVEVSEKATKL